jgi:hypothetical protein
VASPASLAAALQLLYTPEFNNSIVVMHLQSGTFELDSTFTFDARINATEVRLVGEPGATISSSSAGRRLDESARRRLQASVRVIAVGAGAP